MGIFSIDIERFYQEQIDQDNQLLGMFVIQYPIYCIHANILDTTPDPLDNLDRVIVDFLTTKPDFSPLQIASLIGTSKSLVEMRFRALLKDELIEKKGKGLSLTTEGSLVFIEKKQIRQHKRSYDFYLDGTNFRPLPAIYYKYYRNKFISENDFIIRTADNGKERIIKPFGPDMVHRPPIKEDIIDKIMAVGLQDRVAYGIPTGLEIIDDLSYTKLSFQLLISVTRNDGIISKDLLDPFAIFSSSNNLTYFETLKQNIQIFELRLNDRISNLEFRLSSPRKNDGEVKDSIPILSSNWSEIDRYKDSKNKCFLFTNDDLESYLKGVFDIKLSNPESLINSETELKISINKKILLGSSNKNKLISDLIRKRDYRFGHPESNVFIIYLYYDTSDPYVLEIIRFRELVSIAKKTDGVSIEWILAHQQDFSLGYRELFVSSGELDLLERIDIEKFMTQLN